VAQTIQETQKGRIKDGIDAEGKSKVEVIIPEDGVFAGAKGAAMWQRLRMEASYYCDDDECWPDETCCDPRWYHWWTFPEDMTVTAAAPKEL